MKSKTAAWVFIVALLASLGLWGQGKKAKDDSTTRSVQGIVTDASGNRVAKAVVQLKDTKSLQIRSFITAADGAYHFAGLSTNDDYELKALHDGHESSPKTLSVFNSKKTATINLKLKRS